MTAPARRFKAGRIREPLHPNTPRLRVLLRADYIPPVALPDRVNYLAELGGGWAMLGNGPDPSVGPNFAGAGDCEVVRVFNDRRVVEHFYSTDPTPYPPDMALIWELYRTQNPGFDPNGTEDTNGPGSSSDNGMSTTILIDYLHEHGVPGSGVKLAGVATVDLTDAHEVAAAIDIFGRTWLDVLVGNDQQDQFAAGQPWDIVDGQIPQDGHAILGGGQSPDADEAVDVETWAGLTRLTANYVHDGGVEQALVPIWEDEIGQPSFVKGIDAPAAADAFQALFGSAFPGTA